MIWFCTLVRKEIIRFLRVRKQTLIPPLITMTLYLIIFGSFLGSQISNIDWFSYMDYITPWLVLMSVIIASYQNWSFAIFSAKYFGNLDEILISPLSNISILIWYCIWWIVRWFLVGGLVLIVSLFFSNIVIYSISLTLLFLLLTATLFSLAWITNWILAKTFDDINMFPSFILTPLIYLWWVFYSISLLPTFWQTVSKFNPILYMINWIRYWFLWISDVNVLFSLIMVIIVIIILFLVNLRLLYSGYAIKN